MAGGVACRGEKAKKKQPQRNYLEAFPSRRSDAFLVPLTLSALRLGEIRREVPVTVLTGFLGAGHQGGAGGQAMAGAPDGKGRTKPGEHPVARSASTFCLFELLIQLFLFWIPLSF